MDLSSLTENKDGFSEVDGANCELPLHLADDMFSLLSTELSNNAELLQESIHILKKGKIGSTVDLTSQTFELIECSIGDVLNFAENLSFIGTKFQDYIPAIERIFWEELFSEVNARIDSANLNSSRIKVCFSGIEEIFIDKYLIIKILENLLSNALKFSRGEVDLSIINSGLEIQIVISDSGIGIPDYQMEAIFLPFFRGANAKLISGTGIGLTMVRRAINYLHGSIAISSELNEGTKIEVFLPSVS